MIFIFVFVLRSWDDENLGSFGVTKMRVPQFYVSVAAVSLKNIFVDFFASMCHAACSALFFRHNSNVF